MTAAPPRPFTTQEHYVARTRKTLAEIGIDIDPQVFKEAVVDTFSTTYRDIFPAGKSDLPSVDELLVRPDEAKKFCGVIRERLRNIDIPDDMILRPLLNYRKHG